MPEKFQKNLKVKAEGQLESRHIIYFLLVLAVALPLIRPIGLPVNLSKNVIDGYDVLGQATDGSTIVMVSDVSPAGFMDVGATGTAFLEHLFRKNMKVIGVTFIPDAAGSFSRAIKGLGELDVVYGEDYVDLGYIPGVEQGIAAFVRDIHGTAPTDRYGNKIGELQITKDIKSIHDLELVIVLSSGQPGAEGVARQVAPHFKTPIIAACTAGQSTRMSVLWASGHFVGLVPGLKGGAEYEKLLERPAYATASMDALSMIGLFMVGLILTGNVIMLINSKTGNRREASK